MQENTPPQQSTSWNIAESFVDDLSKAPSSFTSTMRGLVKDYQTGNNIISQSNRAAAKRLINCKSLRVPIASMISLLRKDNIDSDTLLTSDELVRQSGGALEVASIITATYYFKRLKKICDKSFWANFSELFHKRLAMAFKLGLRIPKIGCGPTILMETSRALGQACFLSKDKDGFVSYLKSINERGLLEDLSIEEQKWGCTSTQIASLLLTKMGFGSELAKNIASSGERTRKVEKTPQDATSALVLSHKWLEQLLLKGSPPEMTHDSNFYPREDHLKELQQLHTALKQMDDKFLFMEQKDETESQVFDSNSSSDEMLRAEKCGDDVLKLLPESFVKELTPADIEELKNYTAEQLDNLLEELQRGE